jgi:hypothetical protein
MPTITANYHDDPALPEQGANYMNCVRCMAEKPDDISPQQWARQQLAVTKDGRLQLWCTRHNCNIALISFAIRDDGEPS